MKKRYNLLSAALIAGVMLAACGKTPPDEGGANGNNKYPPVTVTTMPGGVVKAGAADKIEIIGTGFDTEHDYIYVVYDDGGSQASDRIPSNVLTLRSTRISFGVPISAGYLGKTVKIYLDRPGYDRMPISKDITFSLPEVSEGYIPDAALRASLSNTSNNPGIASMFDSYGMIDPQLAATVTSIDIGSCGASSLKGIELFTGCTVLRAWDMVNVAELDFSGWQAKGVEIYCERASKVTKIVGAPWCRTLRCHSCPSLTHVDVHNSPWLTRLEISEASASAAPSAVTHLDIRRNHSGKWAQSPSKDDEFQIWGGDSHLKTAQGATIKIDSWFLWDHNTNNSGVPSCWYDVYESWKDRGATVEVYSRVDPYRDELLGTAPSYTAQPDALSPDNKDGSGGSANKWTVEDSHAK